MSYGDASVGRPAGMYWLMLSEVPGAYGGIACIFCGMSLCRGELRNLLRFLVTLSLQPTLLPVSPSHLSLRLLPYLF